MKKWFHICVHEGFDPEDFIMKEVAKSMRKISLILVMILITGLILPFTGCERTEKALTVRLNEVTHSIFYAPMYVAINLGFFEEEGITIELTNGQGADKVMTAVLSGQSDIGFAGAEAAIYVYNEGREDYCKIIAQLTKRDGSFLVGREPDPDFTWEKVRGKEIIGGRKGGMPEMVLEYILKNNGLTPGVDVTVDTSIQFALMAGAFTGGKGDYVSLFEPVASTLEKEGKGYIVTSLGRESGETSYTVFFATKSYIKKNPVTVQKFVNAIYKGQRWVETHTPAEVAEVLKESFPDSDLEILETVVKRYVDQDTWMTVPATKKEPFERLQDIMEMAGVHDKRVPFEEIVDNSFAEKAVETIK